MVPFTCNFVCSTINIVYERFPQLRKNCNTLQTSSPLQCLLISLLILYQNVFNYQLYIHQKKSTVCIKNVVANYPQMALIYFELRCQVYSQKQKSRFITCTNFTQKESIFLIYPQIPLKQTNHYTSILLVLVQSNSLEYSTAYNNIFNVNEIYKFIEYSSILIFQDNALGEVPPLTE